MELWAPYSLDITQHLPIHWLLVYASGHKLCEVIAHPHELYSRMINCGPSFAINAMQGRGPKVDPATPDQPYGGVAHALC